MDISSVISVSNTSRSLNVVIKGTKTKREISLILN